MSMYFTANKIFGLLLTDDEIINFEKEYCRKNKEYLLNEYKDAMKDLMGAEEDVILEELAYLTSDNFTWSEDMFVDQDAREKPLHTYIIDSDNAEGMVFRPIAIAHDSSVQDRTLSEGMIIPAKMGYSEISAFCKMPFYESTDEVVNEFKELVGELLPDDFDYLDHIGEFWYAFCA